MFANIVSVGLALALFIGVSTGLDCSAAQYITQTFKGVINSSGDIVDGRGTVVGRIVMIPGTTFDINAMTIDSSGNVLDLHRSTVGRLVFVPETVVSAVPITRTTILPTERFIEYQIRLPEKTTVVERAPAVVTTKETVVRTTAAPAVVTTTPTVVTKTPTVITTPAVVTTPTVITTPAVVEPVVTGLSAAELAIRKAKVEDSIALNLTQGRITDGQAAELKGELDESASKLSKYSSDGILKDREINSILKRWDRILANMDDYMQRNARECSGLRTK